MSGPLRILPGHFKQFSTTSKLTTVLFDYSESVAKATLNKPKAFNALDLNMVSQLQLEVEKWNSNPNLKAIIMKGSGDKAFCAGGDIKSVYEAKGTPDEYIQDAFFRNLFQLFNSMAKMKPIQIVLWDGIVIGGGIGIAAQAPIRIVTQTSEFSMPEGKIGMHLGIGGAYYFSRMKNHLGYYIGLTGRRVKGHEWIHCGAADYFVKRENLHELEAEILRESGPDTTLMELRNIVRKYQEPCEEGFNNEELINEIFGKQSLEEIYQELELRSKTSSFATETLKLMNMNSPLSLKVIFEQLKRGKDLNFEENLKMDMRIFKRLIKEGDFYEGVRCLLIDKGNKPNWQYKSIFDVPNSKVSECFEKLPEDLELSLVPHDQYNNFPSVLSQKPS